MKSLITLLTILVFSVSANATLQESDLLIIGKDTVYLKTFPLDILNLSERPFGHTRQTAPSTGCWRGYRAIWRIADDKLYLEKISRCRTDKEEGEERLEDFFQRNQIDFNISRGLILADWVTIDLYKMDFSIARNHPDEVYLYDGYGMKDRAKEKNLKLKIVDGRVEIDRLKK